MILIADDDEDDRFLAHESLSSCCAKYAVQFVRDGAELMDYLRREGEYAQAPALPVPDLLFLDINMPRMSGLEALREIKSDPRLCSIPVIMWTTSSAESDLTASYREGASLFVTKPASFRESQTLMCTLAERWLPQL